MWYAPTITVAPENEPVTLDEAKKQVNSVDFDDDDAYLSSLIAAVRDHVEKYCGAAFAPQTAEIKATGWYDMAHLPVRPVSGVTSISYVDTEGATQTLDASVYELRGDSIVLKHGQSWPAMQSGSLITLTAMIGFASAPLAVKQAILLRVEDLYDNRGSGADSEWTTFDSLLSNYRFY